MRLNCGDTAPRTANYKVISPAGEIVGSVYMREGDPLPRGDISAPHREREKGKGEGARPAKPRGAPPLCVIWCPKRRTVREKTCLHSGGIV